MNKLKIMRYVAIFGIVLGLIELFLGILLSKTQFDALFIMVASSVTLIVSLILYSTYIILFYLDKSKVITV